MTHQKKGGKEDMERVYRFKVSLKHQKGLWWGMGEGLHQVLGGCIAVSSLV